MRYLLFLFSCLLLGLTGAHAQVSTVATLGYKGDNGKPEKITAVAFTANSKQVVFGTESGQVVRSTLPQALEANQLAKHETAVCAIVASQDGSLVISASTDHTVKIWEASNNITSTIKSGTVKDESPTLLAISADGRLLASSTPTEVLVWDLATKSILTHIKYTNLKDLRFTPDAKMLLTCGAEAQMVSLWEVATGKLISSLMPDGAPVTKVSSLDISYDGKYLAATSPSDKTLRIWALQSKKQVQKLVQDKDPLKLVRFSNDGQYLFTVSEDNKVKVRDAKNLDLKLSLWEYKEDVQQVALSNDGLYYLATDETPEVKIFEMTWLGIKPWKPADIQSPTIVMITPRMSKERGTEKKAYTNQQRVRVVCKVNDLSGVAQVLINGKPAAHSFASADKYESEETYTFEENVPNKVKVTAIDSLGNITEIDVPVEYQKITGVGDANYHALIIAVQDYTGKDVTPLDNPIADGKRLAQALEDNYTFKPENVSMLENPNRGQIQTRLDELQATLTANDNLLIFYAGHGVWDEEMQQGFWLPVDASLDNRSNWFPNNQLKDYIASIKTKHTLLVADACFSGALFKTRAVTADVTPAIQELYSLNSRKAMTSGALKAVADKSVFLDYLIRALENNSEDYVNALDLFNGFRNDVINNTPNRQVPLYGEIASTGDKGGDFIFVSKRRK